MTDWECDFLAQQKMPMAKLLGKYEALFGGKAFTNNRKFLERKIAYQLQELTSGKISLKVQEKIQQLIDSYDPINKTAAKTRLGDSESQRDNRLPIPGSFISKIYKGKKIDVKVLENGFEYESVIYKNLSAVAKAITGSHWNGFIFFGFRKNGKR